MIQAHWPLAMSAALAAVLWGCGGGDEQNSVIGAPPEPEPMRIGSFDNGGGFRDGVVDLGVETLAAGGLTSVGVSIVDADGVPASDDIPVTFSSVCVNQASASMESPVRTEDGRAATTFYAEGCDITDTITATASPNGQTIRADAQLSVAGAAAGSIEFVSAGPPHTLALKGTGGVGRSETAPVVFRVVNAAGAPASGETVVFTLNTEIGGLSLTPMKGTSGDEGLVQTVVSAGDVATPVRVTATIEDSGISTQSDLLTVTSGLPDSDSITLTPRPPEGHSGCGPGLIPADFLFEVHLADHFNNPVPDGTRVNFTTEGGLIGGSCETNEGRCAVCWRNVNPVPDDGRATVLAYAIGEEAFTDLNSNGRIDGGEPFDDLSEPFRDDDEDGARDPASEPFFDFNGNGMLDGGNGLYNGILCVDAADGDQSHCDLSQKSLYVFDFLVVDMNETRVVAED